MGGGAFDPQKYAQTQSQRKSDGYKTAFTHDEDIRRGKISAAASEMNDPLRVNKNGPFKDKVTRSCEINDDHPNPRGIVVMFDQTGSMGMIPRVLQQKLPALHGLLQTKGYVEDPTICFGAIGDAGRGYEKAPLQIGQFEADNKGEEWLAQLYLEGNGGGNGKESYDLALYFVGYHTYLETMEKQGQKGYLFTIGDENAYDSLMTACGGDLGRYVPKAEWDAALVEGGDLNMQQIADKIHEQYEWFHLCLPYAGRKTYAQDQFKKWIGDRAILLEDPNAVCETIGLCIGLVEGTAGSLEDGMDDLAAAGMDKKAIEAAGKALVKLGAGATQVVQASGELPTQGAQNTAARL